MEYLKQFQIHLSNNNLPQVVNLWQEYCLSEEIDSEEFKQILTEIKESHLAESFGCYADQGLLLWEQMDPDENKDAIFKLIFDIQTSNAPHLAELALNYILEKYKTDPLLTQKIKLVGLREKTSFKNAISNFELLTHMKVGNFFIHTGGWGVGEVIEISMIREQISLEFDYVAGHKELSFVNAFKTLIPITKDHFLARRFGDPEAFEAFAKENPVETIHLLLKNLGPKTASEIKDELEVLVIPEKDWQRWWQTTRTRLKKDTFIEAPKSIRDTFKLRKTEITHEERLAKALGTSPDANTLIEMIYTFMRDFPQALKNPEFAQTLKDQLSEVLFHKEISASQEIQILFILQDLGHEKAKNVPEIISKMNNIEDIVNEIHVLAYKKRMLMEVKKNRDDWPTHFSNLILLVDQNPLRDYLLDTLLSNTQQGLVEEKINEILDTPNISPQAFLWYFQKIMNNEKYPLSDQNGKDRFFESFFILLHMIEMKPNYRDMVKKIADHTIEGFKKFRGMIRMRKLLKPFLPVNLYKLLDTSGLMEGINDMIRQREEGHDPILFDAPIVIVVYYPNMGPLSPIDSTIAFTYGMLAAHSLGLGTCWIGFAIQSLFKSKRMRKLLGVPMDMIVTGVMTLGHPVPVYHRVPPRNPVKVRWLDNGNI